MVVDVLVVVVEVTVVVVVVVTAEPVASAVETWSRLLVSTAAHDASSSVRTQIDARHARTPPLCAYRGEQSASIWRAAMRIPPSRCWRYAGSP